MAIPMFEAAPNIFHTVSVLHPRSGGAARSVSQLTDALSRLEYGKISLISQGFTGEPVVELKENAVTRHLGVSRFRPWLITGFPFESALKQAASYGRPSIIHNHGIWTASNHRACNFACKYDITLIIQPRGMLQPGALEYRSVKKRLGMLAYQRKDLEYASLLMATSEDEAKNLRQLGFHQPMSIIPNGIILDQGKLRMVPKHDRCKGKRVILFLSRLHPTKGLLNLIEAWAQLDILGWELHLAGPDEIGYLSKVMDMTRRLGVDKTVRYIGFVDGDEKEEAYQAADLFVLPTFTENFGIVVAEALSYGVPVITTKGAPWADLDKYGCGWWIDIGVEPLKDALIHAISLSDQERESMGKKAMCYAEKFNWNSVAIETMDVYRWLLNGGSVPNSVILD